MAQEVRRGYWWRDAARWRSPQDPGAFAGHSQDQVWRIRVLDGSEASGECIAMSLIYIDIKGIHGSIETHINKWFLRRKAGSNNQAVVGELVQIRG